MPRATAWNSAIASSSRLPWPHTITPILLMLVRSPRHSWGRLTRSAKSANEPRMFLFARSESLLLSLALDAVFGDPEALNRRQLHPVQLIGRVIAWADARFNRESDTPGRRRNSGAWTTIGLLAGALILGHLVQTLLLALPLGWLWLAIVMSTLIAQRSLYDHVAAVASGLETGGLGGGRLAVSRIVGRDPEALDQAGVSRAAIESLAENFSDGVVAPVFWAALFGLPGLLAYKVDQHRRQHDRPQDARATCISAGRRRGWTICSTWSRRGLPGPDRLRRAVVPARRRPASARWRAMRRDAQASPLAQCRLAGGGVRRRARPRDRRPARLSRRTGRGSLDGRGRPPARRGARTSAWRCGCSSAPAALQAALLIALIWLFD